MDRRVRKTKAAITDALLTLSKKKKLSAISVRELAEAADIPRSTFYLHYHCIDDVIHEYLDEYTRDMSEFMKEITDQGISTVPLPKYWKRINKSNN